MQRVSRCDPPDRPAGRLAGGAPAAGFFAVGFSLKSYKGDAFFVRQTGVAQGGARYERDQLFSTGDVTSTVGLSRWQGLYRVERGDLPGPTYTVAGRCLLMPKRGHCNFDVVMKICHAVVIRRDRPIRLTRP